MVIIGHACQNENGTIYGGQAGDQTGREIRTQEWYKRTGGWDVYLEPLDAAMADRAAAYNEQICADPAFGYTQDSTGRWSGYRSIVANGGKVSGARGDFDCSTKVISEYILAGLPIEPKGSTRDIERVFMATGKFRAYRDAAHLDSGALAVRGGVYLTAGKHVAMVLSNSAAPAMPTPEEQPETAEDAYADIQPPYVLTMGRVRVRVAPGAEHAKMYTSKDEKLPYLETDPVTKWHCVETEMGLGWVSGKANLTKVVRA